MEPSRWAVAIHEAAHIVAAVVLGGPDAVEGAGIELVEGQHGTAVYHPKVAALPPLSQLAVCLAGAVAEELLCYVRFNEAIGEGIPGSDSEQAMQLVERHWRPHLRDWAMSTARATSERVVINCRATIADMAVTLSQHGTLTKADIVKAMNRPERRDGRTFPGRGAERETLGLWREAPEAVKPTPRPKLSYDEYLAGL
jgi:hypothetical protein